MSRKIFKNFRNRRFQYRVELNDNQHNPIPYDFRTPFIFFRKKCKEYNEVTIDYNTIVKSQLDRPIIRILKDAHLWCDQNCNDRWSFKSHGRFHIEQTIECRHVTFVHTPKFYFENKVDAINFVLRFC